MRWTLSAFLMLVVLHLAACACASGGTSESSLDWADRILTKAMLPPTTTVESSEATEWPITGAPRYDLRRAEFAYGGILAKYGPSVRAYVGLARSRMGQGRYATAVRSYQSALDLSPGAPKVRDELDLAQRSARVAASARTLLPKSHTVLRTLLFPVDRTRELWLVLSGRIDEASEDLVHAATFDGADFRLTLVEGTGTGVRSIRQSAQLGFPGNTEGEFNDVQLYVMDITGDGIPEVVIPEVFVGADWIPSHLDVFAWRDGRLFHALGVKSDMPVELRDIDGDGSYEAVNSHAIGRSLCHADQPLWTDIFAYRDGSYHIANDRFPGQFNRLRAEIRRLLRQHPSDPELLKYLGVAEQILGQNHKALRTYSHARSVWAEELREERDHHRRVQIRAQLGDLLRRMHDIGALRHTAHRTQPSTGADQFEASHHHAIDRTQRQRWQPVIGLPPLLI